MLLCCPTVLGYKTEPEDLRSKPHTTVHFSLKHAYYNTFVDLYIKLIYDRCSCQCQCLCPAFSALSTILCYFTKVKLFLEREHLICKYNVLCNLL